MQNQHQYYRKGDGAGYKPQPGRQILLKGFDEQKSGDSHQRLRQAEKILHQAAFIGLVQRGTITRLKARPSGILWMAMAVVMKRPRLRLPLNDTPTLTPSAKEWMVIMPKNEQDF